MIAYIRNTIEDLHPLAQFGLLWCLVVGAIFWAGQHIGRRVGALMYDILPARMLELLLKLDSVDYNTVPTQAQRRDKASSHLAGILAVALFLVCLNIEHKKTLWHPDIIGTLLPAETLSQVSKDMVGAVIESLLLVSILSTFASRNDPM